MDANTNIMNGDNSKSSGRSSNVLVNIERACEITGKYLKYFQTVTICHSLVTGCRY